jgi:hypothetical protein
MTWTTETIKQLREDSDISMTELSHLLDTDITVVSRWERGVTEVSDQLASKLDLIEWALNDRFYSWRTATGWDREGHPVPYRCRREGNLLVIQMGRIAKTKRRESLFVPFSEVRHHLDTMMRMFQED